MSRNSRSLLSLLRRCAAVRQLPSPAGVATRGGVLSGSCGLVQRRTWASTTWTGRCAQGLCQLRAAVNAGQPGLCTKAGAPCEDEYPPLPAYESDSEPVRKELHILQVKGLPWSCSAEDVLQFFSECKIRDGVNGIHLTLDRLGKSTGRAFIEMEQKADIIKALEKHRQYLGPRYIEVYEVTESDAESILKKQAQDSEDNWVVRLRGLPYSCTESDIAQFFSGLDIAENGITIVTDRRGRNSGEAFVQFSTGAAADEALQRDREVIGNRYVEVFPSRSDEIRSSWRRTTASSASPQTSHKTGSADSSATLHHCVHMRGLPYQVSAGDIVKFFSPLVVSKILIEYGPNGRPIGEADVYFSCHKDAVFAMSRDKLYIGERYIELFLNSTSDSDRR